MNERILDDILGRGPLWLGRVTPHHPSSVQQRGHVPVPPPISTRHLLALLLRPTVSGPRGDCAGHLSEPAEEALEQLSNVNSGVAFAPPSDFLVAKSVNGCEGGLDSLGRAARRIAACRAETCGGTVGRRVGQASFAMANRRASDVDVGFGHIEGGEEGG